MQVGLCSVVHIFECREHIYFIRFIYAFYVKNLNNIFPDVQNHIVFFLYFCLYVVYVFVLFFPYLENNKVSIYFPVRSDDVIKTEATWRTVDSDQRQLIWIYTFSVVVVLVVALR